MQSFIEDFNEAQEVLKNFIEDEKNFKNLKNAGELMVSAVQNGKKIISCGNGGSMCDAMHFAEELTGIFRYVRKAVPAISISDPSHLTCVSNDLGFEQAFARFIEGMGNSGDILLAISTSGNSKNILNAVRVAKEKGMEIIALTGKNGGELANLCNVEIRVSHHGYSDRIQEIHIKIIHSLIRYIENNLKE